MALALGIGANVALFTVVHCVLLKPLPFKDQDRLVRLYEARHQRERVPGQCAGGWHVRIVAVAGEELRSDGAQEGIVYNLSGAGGQLAEVVYAQSVTWNFFPMLGVEATQGRVFTSQR